MNTWTWIIRAAWVVIGLVVVYMLPSDALESVLWGIFGAITFPIALIVIVIVGPAREEAATPSTT